ncbi:hypothetical protein [Companilactobacillus jidongensis]|uniref:hypothetical protein n=1 Tax=Companilactobacillus jidongensis TaxID=2486006 RepID=UPI000F7A002D|nr:hypothetical protein [Companilactobacillus jidongensis]
MKVSDQTELFELVYSRQNNIYVIGEAYEICRSVLYSTKNVEVEVKPNPLAKVTSLFRSSSTKQLDNLRRIIANKYHIKETKNEDEYRLVLRH